MVLSGSAEEASAQERIEAQNAFTSPVAADTIATSGDGKNPCTRNDDGEGGEEEEGTTSESLGNDNASLKESEGASVAHDDNGECAEKPLNHSEEMEVFDSTTESTNRDTTINESFSTENVKTKTEPPPRSKISDASSGTRSPDKTENGSPQDTEAPMQPQPKLESKLERKLERRSSEGNLTQTLLLGLPIDSLHCIASFLAPREWSNFGRCSGGATRICRDIFRRVQMHGFRCATEVVIAWKMKQHADAKELAALYIGAGVPIYPHSLGHSYHTMVWKMGVEAKEMETLPESSSEEESVTQSNQEVDNSNSSDDARAQRRPVDRFYAERHETRGREGLNLSTSYLEEKSLYTMSAEKYSNAANSFAQSVRRQMSLAPNRFLVRPQPNNNNMALGEETLNNGLRGATGPAVPPPQLLRLASSGHVTTSPSNVLRRGLARSNSNSELRRRTPKALVKIHRHLLDQHLLGCPSVDDKDGMMAIATVSLSADFFHPHFTFRSLTGNNQSCSTELSTKFASSDGLVSGERLPTWNTSVAPPQHAMSIGTIGLLADPVASMHGHRLPTGNGTDDSESEDEPPIQHVENALPEPIFEPLAGPLDHASTLQPPPQASFVSSALADSYLNPTYPNILMNVDLEVYSASSTHSKIDTDVTDIKDIRNHLRARFGAYRRRLEKLLVQKDSNRFDECMLDFWDEFLPQTANIHYFDRHTAVPRISCLHKFLTKPCPKALGVVQCEIERIKLGSKKKGVNMKGRFFPTYEYRLFIRHRPPENPDGSEPSRRDTVLMVAKNRGRKHVEASTQPIGGGGKKGANNYLLHIPQQDDIDHHFEGVNGHDNTARVPNGAGNCSMILDRPSLMGRLQSNFIGTEFQIFTSQNVQKVLSKEPPVRSSTTPINEEMNRVGSDDDYGYDSGVSSDNPSSTGRRRSRFGRLSLRRTSTPNASEQRAITEDVNSTQPPTQHRIPPRRSRSSGDKQENRRIRTSRRAIANHSDGVEVQQPLAVQSEKEDGAITYTANLLGSRPRIMDVCIPKVSPDGTPGAEWKRYLDICLPEVENGAGNRMLHHLKQIQQRMENEEQERGANHEATGTGSANDYSPPDDFGLLALQNRPPWWNIELGSFVLNFGGRVSVASVKNFQLCNRNDQDYIMLQFGRIQGRHSFTMDFQHPLTAVQAFAIAISSLQSKISFG